MRDVTPRSRSSGESAPTGRSCSSANSETWAYNMFRIWSKSSSASKSGSSVPGCSPFPCVIACSAVLELSPFTAADRRLEGKSRVPGEIDPGVLRHFGDIGVDHRPAHRLCIDGREMRLRQELAYDLGGLAGVDEIIDDQHALAPTAADADDVARNVLEHLELALAGVIVARHADRLDQADVEFARDDRGRDQAAAGHADDRLERAGAGEPPDQRPCVAVELVPGDGKGLLRLQLLRLRLLKRLRHELR